MQTPTDPAPRAPAQDVIEDLRLAASKMRGAERRAFQAAMALKYCGGSARVAETVFGWGREAVGQGLAERRTGLVCFDGRAGRNGRSRWEDAHPQVAEAVRQLAEAHSQQDPTFRSSLSYTRLTSPKMLAALRERGFEEEQLPSQSTMARVLNRLGFRLRKVVKAKPQKKIKETDAIFENIKDKDREALESGDVMRVSVDCKASVKIGEYSRGGRSRSEVKAADHDMGCQEKYTPFGIVDEQTGGLHIAFGSSFKTSDFIVDSLKWWWAGLDQPRRDATRQLQIKVDNGPESSGVRTQFLKRMVQFADDIGKSIQLVYYPPYHSKYNPIERCWGVLEQAWNGTLLTSVETMLEWAAGMTWQGLNPVVELSAKVYEKGVKLGKAAMREVEKRLERNSLLPKYDILIRPAQEGGAPVEYF